jgi:heme/copper-type cytochrome/quinol oxidase subunit 2
MSITATTLVCMILGVVLPVFASYIDIMNLPPDVKCATPSVGFAFLGLLITVIFVPLSAIIFYFMVYYKRKKVVKHLILVDEQYS